MQQDKPSIQIIKQLLDSAPRGTVHRGRILLGSRATGADIALSYIVVVGREPGPTLWINGQVHGTEVCAIVAGIEFCRQLDPGQMSGNIVFTASGNPLALESRTWATQQDFGQNLDTSFPGRPDGFITERMAHRLFSEIVAVRPDLLLSMHAQGTDFCSKIYGVYKLPSNSPVEPSDLYPFMRIFEPFAICHMRVGPGADEHPGHHAGALDYQAMAQGIPAFMIEFGVAQRSPPDEVRFGVQCYFGVCAELGILPADHKTTGSSHSRLVTSRGHLNVDVGGLWQSYLTPGALVKAGDPIGTITDFTGIVVDTVKMPMDVLLIAIRQDPVVHSGDSVAYLAKQWTSLDLA